MATMTMARGSAATTVTAVDSESQYYIRRRREHSHEADVIVVGAGIFGCAAAFALANQGRSVLLLERSMKEPDRIVGELLQPGGLSALRKLGLGDCVEGIGAAYCDGYAVMYDGTQVVVPYPTRDSEGNLTHAWGGAGKEGKRDQGRSFHHGRFITNLRKKCLGHPNITVVETEVKSTVKGDDSDDVLGVETQTTDREAGSKKKDYFFAALTVIADGYNSKFRKDVITGTPTSKSKFYALELIDCKLPEPGFGHVIIGTAAFPVLLYQIGTHETRALFDVPSDLPEASVAAGGVRNYIRNHAIPALPASVRPSAEAALDRGGIPRSMPNNWLPPSKQSRRGLVLLGDALNMRHPLTGGGMTVAFNDVVLLADLLSPSRVPQLGDVAAVQRAMGDFYWRRKSLTGIINVLAQALYALFAANDRQLRALQKGCFEYFLRDMTDGPAGLLGGIIARPVILFYHFFSVAFLAIWLHACDVIGTPLGIWKAPLVLIDMILILWKACVVFLPVMWREWFM